MSFMSTISDQGHPIGKADDEWKSYRIISHIELLTDDDLYTGENDSF